MLNTLLDKRHLSVYQCSKLSGIPYTTLLEAVRGKTNLCKCSAEMVLKLARVLNTSMESLLEKSNDFRIDSEVYKSNVCHAVKEQGALDFIIHTLKSNDVRRLWQKKWYFESFYLLAMVDYLSRLNNLPLSNSYDDIRACSLKDPFYPRDILMAEKLHPQTQNLKKCRENAIPEFMRFNIVEMEIENVY